MTVHPRPHDVDETVFHGIATAAPSMRALFERIRKVARTDASVLIRGETGTGKELVANAIHSLGPRSTKAFRVVNCATFTPELLASELFGHVRGAFTGAVRERRGLFALADGGTVFLDEVAEIPLEIQARLLRVIQEQRFVPVGGSDPVQVDVRLMSATHRALRREVEEKRFRSDLMYRIRVVPLFLPPLRERHGDVEVLFWRFVDQFNESGFRHVTEIDDIALQALLEYEWPGNVRELRNVVEHAFALGEGPTIVLDDLTPELRGEAPPEPPTLERSEPTTLEELERQRIFDALRQTGGKKGEAAEVLGISRSTLWRRLRELGLQS